MKKIVLVFIFIITICSTVFATDVNVQINSEKVNFTDSEGNTVNAQVVNSRTMVPMRKIFELLGLEVEWDGENKIVTGKSENITIILQIDNNVATKEVAGQKKEIILDVPPMLIEDRTMVPLRFIAESLDKQVGWDNKERTAVIIDYTYFLNTLKSKATPLYNFLVNDLAKSKNEGTIYYDDQYIHKYYDLNDSNKNTEFSINTKISSKENQQKVTLNISGNSDLAKEIITEGWNSSLFELNYDDEKIIISTDNTKLIQMLNLKKNGKEYTYSELSLNKNIDSGLENLFRVWANIDDEKIDVNTFSKLQTDFNSFCNLFSNATTVNGETTYNFSIRYATYNLDYFDLARLDNFIFNNEHIKIFNIVNRMFFKTDLTSDEMIYDNSNIKLKITIKNQSNEADIFIEAINEYNEKNEYTLNLKKIPEVKQ